MNVSTSAVKEIRQEFAKLKPAKVTPDGKRSLTLKGAIFALAPTLERMKKRGFELQELTDMLHAKGIDLKTQTLIKYLNEYRRKKGTRKNAKKKTMRAGDVTADKKEEDEREELQEEKKLKAAQTSAPQPVENTEACAAPAVLSDSAVFYWTMPCPAVNMFAMSNLTPREKSHVASNRPAGTDYIPPN